MSQEKKDEEDSSVFKVGSMHRYKDLKITLEKHGRRLITTIGNNTDNTSINRTLITRKQKCEEKNNCMDISCDKQMKSLTRNLGHG